MVEHVASMVAKNVSSYAAKACVEDTVQRATQSLPNVVAQLGPVASDTLSAPLHLLNPALEQVLGEALCQVRHRSSHCSCAKLLCMHVLILLQTTGVIPMQALLAALRMQEQQIKRRVVRALTALAPLDFEEVVVGAKSS